MERKEIKGKQKKDVSISFLSNYPVKVYTSKFVSRESYYKIFAKVVPFTFPALASSVSR
jgi:hypothetical protein